MTANRSKKMSIAAKNAEIEWVVAHERQASAEPRVEREHVDEPQLDVVQQAPDEVVWVPTEPQDASDAADAPRVAKKAPRAAGAKPARSAGKPQRKTADDAATDAASANDEPAPSAPERKPKREAKRSATQPDAAEDASTKGDAAARKGALAEEHAVEVATAATEPSAAAQLTKKSKLQKFVAERAEQRAAQRREDHATEPTGVPPTTGVGNLATGGAQDSAHAEAALEPDPTATAAPASTMQPMEDFLAELGTLSVAELVKRHIEVVGKSPRIKNRVWLQRKLAWIEQTRRYGGLSTAAKKRLDELMGEIELPVPMSRTAKADAPATRSADDMPLGTRLERKWRDRVIVATRVEGGWDCEGAIYRTLSGAAKTISGTHCSGPAWFGVWRPKGGAR
jgi:hypothetical protein